MIATTLAPLFPNTDDLDTPMLYSDQLKGSPGPDGGTYTGEYYRENLTWFFLVACDFGDYETTISPVQAAPAAAQPVKRSLQPGQCHRVAPVHLGHRGEQSGRAGEIFTVQIGLRQHQLVLERRKGRRGSRGGRGRERGRRRARRQLCSSRRLLRVRRLRSRVLGKNRGWDDQRRQHQRCDERVLQRARPARIHDDLRGKQVTHNE